MEYKHKWRIPIIVSIVANLGLMGLAGVLWWNHEETPVEQEIVEVTIGSDSDAGQAGGSEGGPQISAPAESKVEVPPPVTSVEEANAILEEVHHQVQETPTQPTPLAQPTQATTSVANTAATPSSTPGTGSGNATGTGTGSGQGQGTGSGSGTGSGTGNGGSGKGSGQATPAPDPNRIVQRGSLSISRDVEAEYPPSMIRAGKSGSVTVRVLVEKDGSVSSVELTGSSGESAFDNAVLKVARRWRFVPATENGHPVRAYASRTYTFRLQ